MPEHFSLAGRAWLPVALSDGRRELVRLCSISQPFDGQPIVRIATGRPDCDISLTEFLIGLLAVGMGPMDQRAWVGRYRNPPSAAEIDAALLPFAEALSLDGDSARFFQDRDQLDGGATPIEALFIDAPGNKAISDNADHFVKRGRTSALSRNGAAIALLTLQTSAPAGGAGNRTSLRGGGPLTTLVVPRAADGREPTLWQRLWANVPSGFAASAAEASQVFPWLVPTRTSDPKNKGDTTTPEHVHRAHAFFGMPRRIRLIFEPNTGRVACDLLGIIDDVIVTSYVTRPWGTNYSAWSGSEGHPLSPYYKVKGADVQLLPLHLQTSRVGYRQWLGLATDANELRLPAAIVAEFKNKRAGDLIRSSELSRSNRHNVRLLACGYAMDNMKPLDFGEALMPLIVTGSQEGDREVSENAKALLAAAEAAASQLVNSIKRALYGAKTKADSDSSVLGAARARFWAETEDRFYQLLQDAADRIIEAGDAIETMNEGLSKELKEKWLDAIKRRALAIFDDTAPIDAAESDKITDLIEGRKFLALAFRGYGAYGNAIYAALGLPIPDKKRK